MAFASDKHAYGISDRSGFRYRLRDMKREWTGALVGPDEYEEKHPQLYPPRPGPDPQALRDPRPDQAEALQVYVGIPLVENPNLSSLRGIAKVGFVTVIVTTEGDESVNVTGSSSFATVGNVTVAGDAGTWDSTGETLDSTGQTYDEG